MKTKMILFSLISGLLLVAGCKTTDPQKTTPISWKQQQGYLSRARDPRIFGLSFYDTPSGVQVRGGSRLHPGRSEVLEMLVDEPPRSVVNIKGNFGVQWPVLLDFTSTGTWFEFETAQKLGAHPVGGRKAVLVNRPGDDVPACQSLLPSLRLGQMFVENVLVYVRMANGSLGIAGRDVTDPQPKGVVGWGVLKKFKQIRLLYPLGKIGLVTTDAYEPNPAAIVAKIPLVRHAGVCAIYAWVDGKKSMVLIDPMGDFDVAGSASSVKLSDDLVVSPTQTESSTGEVRLGARFLQDYLVTICPQEGVVYFETVVSEDDG